MSLSNLSSQFWSSKTNELQQFQEIQRGRLEFIEGKIALKNTQAEELKGKIRQIDPQLIGELRVTNGSWFKKLIGDIFYKLKTLFSFVFGKLNQNLNQYRLCSREIIDLTRESLELQRDMKKTQLERVLASGRQQKFLKDEKARIAALSALSPIATFSSLQTLTPQDVFASMPLINTVLYGSSLIANLYHRFRGAVQAPSLNETVPLLPKSPSVGSLVDDEADQDELVLQSSEAISPQATFPAKETIQSKFIATIKTYATLAGMNEETAELFANKFFPEVSTFTEKKDAKKMIAELDIKFPTKMRLSTSIQGKAIEFIAEPNLKLQYNYAEQKFIFEANKFTTKTPIGEFYIVDLKANEEGLPMNGRKTGFTSFIPLPETTMPYDVFYSIFRASSFQFA